MIDYKNDLIYVQGSIPGESGQYVTCRALVGVKGSSYRNEVVPKGPGQTGPFPSFGPDIHFFVRDSSQISCTECSYPSLNLDSP